MTGRRALLLLAAVVVASWLFLELCSYLFTGLSCGGTGCG